MTAASEAQGLYPSAIIELFRLDASALSDGNGNTGPILHFTNTGTVTVAGQDYTPLPAQIEQIEFRPGEAPPQPTLSLSTITTDMRAYILAFDNLRGARLQVSSVFARHVDGGADADPSQVFAGTTWTLDQMTFSNQVSTWVLRSDLDKEGTRIPRRTIARDFCAFATRRPDGNGGWIYPDRGCPYTAAAIFDSDGNVTADPTAEHFDRTLNTCCKRRFTSDLATATAEGTQYSESLPFGGFPGCERL